MIRITRQTDYGIVLLSYLAGQPEGRVTTSRDLSRWSSIPLPMVSKILKTLAREDILVSHRGMKGGYSLNVQPDEISVACVIAALEGPIGITECSTTSGSCEQEACCPVRSNWQVISDAVRDTLEKIPLSAMMVGAKPLAISDSERKREWNG